MYVAMRMASPTVIAEMCNKHDEFMSSRNVTPIGSHPIGSKKAFKLNMEAIWQLFILQIQANQKLLNPFHYTSNY